MIGTERLSRGERRRISKEDEAWLARPFDLNSSPRAIQAYTRHLAFMLLDTQLKRRACSAAAFAGQLMDTAAAKHVQGPVACATGCYHCCTTFVSATIPEIFRLAHAVDARNFIAFVVSVS